MPENRIVRGGGNVEPCDAPYEAHIKVDSADSDKLKWNANNVEYVAVSTTQLQTLTNKTLTAPVITNTMTSVTVTPVAIHAGTSGSILLLDRAAGATITLPAPASGLEFEFIVKTAPTSGNYVIVTSGGANIIVVEVTPLEVNDTVDGIWDDNADTVTFVQNQAAKGDRIKFVSDGTSWYGSGVCKLTAAVTTSTT